MRPPPTPSSSARSARGAISWVTAVLLLLLIGAGYLAVMFGPVYILNYEVKQVVRDYLNQAVKNPDDEGLKADMVHKLRTLETRPGVDEFGTPVQIPTIQIDSSGVRWERSAETTPPTLRVAFCYTRAVAAPLFRRSIQRTICVDIEGDLTRPDWGPVR
jgi:hypothetical protein